MRSLVGFVLLLALAAPAVAQDKPAVIVTDPSARSYKAAVQGFADRRPVPESEVPSELRATIGSALGFSQLFEVVDPKAFLGPDVTVQLDAGPPPDCGSWRTIGADALLQGVLGEEGGQLVVEFRVYDVARCRSLLRKRYRGGRGDVELIGRRIADDVVNEFTGRPGVASTEIAFISNRSGNKEVYVMNADGSAQRAATGNRSINAFPAWAPNGDELLYTSYRYRGQPALFLLSRGRRKPGRLLSRIDDGGPVYRGSFAPDGERLAFVKSVDGAPEIFTAGPAGQSLRRLTRHRAIDISPTWSPDGKRLAFVSDRSGAPQVYVMDTDGSNVRRLTFQGTYNTAPAWSPDGRWIAYESRVGGQFDIWLIDPEGDVSLPIVTHPRSDESPSWSPDGRFLAFSSTRRGRADIYTVGVDGRNVRRVTRGDGDNTSPAWGPHPR